MTVNGLILVAERERWVGMFIKKLNMDLVEY